jgi:4-hydroxy-tetrahydrodipicolinate synthase
MSIGGHGIISVASNGMPAEMARMVELAESGDYAGARTLHNRLMPFMTVNFVEANPIPIKAAMALMGLLDERYRLPMVAARPASRERIAAVLESLAGAVRA